MRCHISKARYEAILKKYRAKEVEIDGQRVIIYERRENEDASVH